MNQENEVGMNQKNVGEGALRKSRLALPINQWVIQLYGSPTYIVSDKDPNKNYLVHEELE
jgi:hypothetical protein